MSKGISCESCVGACCKGNEVMSLSATKAAFMQEANPGMIEILPALPGHSWRRARPDSLAELPSRNSPELNDMLRSIRDQAKSSLSNGDGLYYLDTTCGYLGVDNKCTVYAERPAACRELTVGSGACRLARLREGIGPATGIMSLPLIERPPIAS